MFFSDRSDAGKQLALALESYKGKDKDVVIFALPRGGVPVAIEVASYLGASLDLLLVRKIGVPIQPELAMAAVVDSAQPVLVRNEEVIRRAQVSVREFEQLRQCAVAELQRRRQLYMTGRPAQDALGRVAIIVDDGIATGATMLAAVRGLRQRHPSKIVVAVPVAPAYELTAIMAEADDVVCLHTLDYFEAVGSYYADFPQLSDDVVVALMGASCAGT
ncbi:phosphoribosyltransferase family protein [Rhizobium sp. IBUN]|uniref:phosphoribosyltransferase n=1 Tax=Rhizobium sp. IBUN TaxID=1042326 RepID=UPI0004257EB3|nr:phosphoribosyltransferase family protein [Rhizobium sp. IBUN]